ncbi:hypothetical protein [Acidimangrovimonas sediminis]|uniref:hypothetical protein n=1 Tax=Acidimangrovimonas sediminis TaxID=2056283 RepID=UPI000C80D8D6|nr:hypothetical protein [Acidimangrovimonas sediminis]
MTKKLLLEQIWNGSVSAWPTGEKGDIARGIAALLPVQTVCVDNAAPHGVPRVLPEATELLPGLTLGDVLAEELGIEVPFGALVVFETVVNAAVIGSSEHDIGCTSDEVLRHIVSGLDGRASLAPAAARSEAKQRNLGFRDDGLNARFFGAGRRASPMAEAVPSGARRLARDDRTVS